MATEALVIPLLESTRKLVAELDRAGFQVTGAAWSKLDDAGEYRLLVATPLVESRDVASLYGEVRAAIGRVGDERLDVNDVSLVSPDHESFVALRGAFDPGKAEMLRLRNAMVRGRSFEDVFVLRF